MDRFWVIVGHVLWATSVGALLAISTPILFAVVAILWLSVFTELVRKQLPGQGWRNGLSTLLMQGAVIVVVLIAAALAPVKTQARLLEHPVFLAKTDMTLQELQELTATGQVRVPALRSITFPETEAAKVVRWPAKELTLREFVATVEEQTPLRHRFGSCGNGLTILWGNDCVFGLRLEVPREQLAP